MKKFALIGAAGYVAKRHMKAILETKNRLEVIVDPSDSVGIIDSYFPEAKYYSEFKNFEDYLEGQNDVRGAIDIVSVCSPNYMHEAHCRSGLLNNADVICEKPIVLNPQDLERLQKVETETGRKIFNILQLRLHDSIRQLKNRVSYSDRDNYEIDLTYITSRGPWYQSSWKGDVLKSGGISTNIGVHFFDMLIWVFGKVKKSTVHLHDDYRSAGCLELEKANIRWLLSIRKEDLPTKYLQAGKSVFRSITVDEENIEFSEGFSELHTDSYRDILYHQGFGTDEVKDVIQLVHDIRNTKPIGLKGDFHPFLSVQNVF